MVEIELPKVKLTHWVLMWSDHTAWWFKLGSWLGFKCSTERNICKWTVVRKRNIFRQEPHPCRAVTEVILSIPSFISWLKLEWNGVESWFVYSCFKHYVTYSQLELSFQDNSQRWAVFYGFSALHMPLLSTRPDKPVYKSAAADGPLDICPQYVYCHWCCNTSEQPEWIC